MKNRSEEEPESALAQQFEAFRKPAIGCLWLLGAICIVLIALLLFGRTIPIGVPEGAIVRSGDSITSASGAYVATLEKGQPSGGVEMSIPVITDSAGTEVFRDEMSYSQRHGVIIAWDGDDASEVLWIKSNDVGTYRVDLVRGSWVKSHDPDIPAWIVG